MMPMFVIHNLGGAMLMEVLSRRRSRMTDDAYGATVAKGGCPGASAS